MKVDRNIPIPPKGGNKRYPWAQLKVGDSFFVEGGNPGGILYCGASYAKHHNPKMKFSSRQENGGTRIWRTR